MNTSEWVKMLGIPKDAILDKNFPKKILYQNLELSTSEKELIQNGIKRLRWIGSIKESNSNISKYKDDIVQYEEIQYFFLEVNSQDTASKVSKLLFNLVPYPQFLIISFEENYQFQMAFTKINSNDSNLLVLEKIYESKWKSVKSNTIKKDLKPFHYSYQKMTNLKEYYESLLVVLVRERLNVSEDNKLENSKEIIQDFNYFQELDGKIKNLMKLVKVEKQLNKRIELQFELTRLKNEQKGILL